MFSDPQTAVDPALLEEPYLTAGSSGKVIRLGVSLEADLEQLTLREIFTSLSRLARYTGHGRRLYSVLEHSLHMARWAEANRSRELALICLLHDGHEAITGDSIRPLKHTRSPAWDLLKGRTARHLYQRFAGDVPWHQLAGAVSEIDSRITTDEMLMLFDDLPRLVVADLPMPLGLEIDADPEPEPETLVDHALALYAFLSPAEVSEHAA